jgi:hypothetical protein
MTGTVLCLSKMPEAIMLPPEAQKKEDDEPEGKEKKADDNGKEHFSEKDLLVFPKGLIQKVHLSFTIETSRGSLWVEQDQMGDEEDHDHEPYCRQGQSYKFLIPGI